jgi:hypothetical protein
MTLNSGSIGRNRVNVAAYAAKAYSLELAFVFLAFLRFGQTGAQPRASNVPVETDRPLSLNMIDVFNRKSQMLFWGNIYRCSAEKIEPKFFQMLSNFLGETLNKNQSPGERLRLANNICLTE